MIKSNLRKISMGIFLLSLISLNLNAQEKSQKEFDFNFIPQIDFGILQIEKDTFLYSPSGNLQFKYQKNEGSEINCPDVIAGSLYYGQDFFLENTSGSEGNLFHKLGLFGKVVTGKNTFLFKIDDHGANPFESYKSFEGLLFYARQIIDTDSTQLDIGGGLAATDTGFIIGGFDLFVVPLPMIHFSYINHIINTELEWIGLPDGCMTLFPQSMFHVYLSFALAGFDLPFDIMGDFALSFYPFRDGFLKDLAYISAGVSHEVKKFRIDTKNSIKYDYFTAYGQLSITALTLRGGYAFGGRKIFRGNDSKNIQNYDGGFFATVQAMYKFQSDRQEKDENE